MTDEMYSSIVSHIRDEIADVAAYRNLAERAEGYTQDVLRHIVADEESHARYLAKALKRAGRDMPEDAWSEYQAMEAQFQGVSSR